MPSYPIVWHDAETDHPEENRVVIFLRKETDANKAIRSDKELLAMWRDGKYYIFEVGNCEWAEYDYYFAYWHNHETPAPLSDFQWTDGGPEPYRHVPFYALAEARRNRIG